MRRRGGGERWVFSWERPEQLWALVKGQNVDLPAFIWSDGGWVSLHLWYTRQCLVYRALLHLGGRGETPFGVWPWGTLSTGENGTDCSPVRWFSDEVCHQNWELIAPSPESSCLFHQQHVMNSDCHDLKGRDFKSHFLNSHCPLCVVKLVPRQNYSERSTGLMFW